MVMGVQARTADDAEVRFIEAYEAAHARTVRVAVALCGDRSVGEEVAHDAWVGAYRRHCEQPLRDVVPYVHRAVVNGARSRGRRRVLERAHLRTDRGVAAEDAAPAVDDRMVLVPLLQRLPVRMRTAVVLRIVADLSVQQTASVMDISEGAVKSATSRGLDRLRMLVEESGEDD
jgi:RNA polymerase sigma factor (sigma-70 family)